MVATAVIF